MVIRVWQLAAAVLLLIAGVPIAIYLIDHGHEIPLVVCFVVVSTTIWLSFDAGKRDWSESESRWAPRNTTMWVIASLLLWIVVFPIYLVQRGRVPLKGDIDDISPSQRGQRSDDDGLVSTASVSDPNTSEGRNHGMAEKHEQEQLLPPIPEQAAIQQSPKGSMILGQITTELERLAALRSSGALDEEEFHAAKARVLEGSATSTVTTPEAPVRPVEPPGVISTLSVVMQARDEQAEFMNAQELASHLGVTERSVRRWIERGELPAEKSGRRYVIRREDGERMRHRAPGSRVAEDGSQLEGVTQSEAGERTRLGAFGSEVAEDGSQLEGVAAALDRELAEWRGRYKELQERLKRVEVELDAERRRTIRLELERDLVENHMAAPRAA